MKEKTTAQQVRLDPSHRRLLAELAVKLDLSMSQVVRRAIRELAKKHKIS